MRAQARPEHRRDRHGRDQAAIGEHAQRHERITATGFDHRERHEQRGAETEGGEDGRRGPAPLGALRQDEHQQRDPGGRGQRPGQVEAASPCRGTVLSRAVLSGAVLSGAVLSRAVLSGAVSGRDGSGRVGGQERKRRQQSRAAHPGALRRGPARREDRPTAALHADADGGPSEIATPRLVTELATERDRINRMIIDLVRSRDVLDEVIDTASGQTTT
ncbi:pentapeptide repeat-containing protein [Nonomuraea sp. NPDC049129]|uniref:pentapeptide repeat-containing protein n=1 Tax=Nonomuraea sp. NPDC049129 TaxID=3155272 RepID=UPI0033C86A0C